MKREILIHPDPRLKKPCAPVPDLSDALRALADDMLETMYDAPGIGLAAPQVGILSRLLVMDCVKEEGATPRPMVMFNPEIVASSDEKSTLRGGLPVDPRAVRRRDPPAEVELRWLDRDGHERHAGFDGLWATCVQHEIDHLNGKLFIDYLGPMRRQMITRKMQKLKREQARG